MIIFPLNKQKLYSVKKNKVLNTAFIYDTLIFLKMKYP